MRSARSAASLAVGLILALAWPSPGLSADDLAYYETGARASALGGAFTARADDATVLFYNPAGLAFLGGVRFKTDLTFGKRSTSAAWPESGPAYRSSPLKFGATLAVSWQPFKRVALGVGVFSPYNYEYRWPLAWPATTVSALSQVRTISIRSALAIELFKGFAVSAGLDILSSNLTWDHNIAFNMETYPLPEDALVNSDHYLTGHGLGFVAGALWKIAPAVQVGIRYQSSNAIDYSGENKFLVIYQGSATLAVPDPVQGTRAVFNLLNLFYVPQEVTGRQTFPRELACGIVLKPFSRLSLAVDVQWDRWSRFGDWVFRSVNEGGDLSPEFTPIFEEFYGVTPDYGVQGVPLPLGDTKKIKVGLEFVPRRYFAVRAGYARHESSLDADGRSPVYPDLDHNIFSFGLGYDGPVFSIWDDDERVADLSFDLFVRYSSAEPGRSAFPGAEMTYRSDRFIYGVGAGFSF